MAAHPPLEHLSRVIGVLGHATIAYEVSQDPCDQRTARKTEQKDLRILLRIVPLRKLFVMPDRDVKRPHAEKMADYDGAGNGARAFLEMNALGAVLHARLGEDGHVGAFMDTLPRPFRQKHIVHPAVLSMRKAVTHHVRRPFRAV
jgi:hypothetical protein